MPADEDDDVAAPAGTANAPEEDSEGDDDDILGFDV